MNPDERTEVDASDLTAALTLMPADKPYRLSLTDRATTSPNEASVHLITANELPPGVEAHGFTHFLYATLPLPGAVTRIGGAVLGAPEVVLRELLPSFEALFNQIAVVLGCSRSTVHSLRGNLALPAGHFSSSPGRRKTS